MNQLKEKYRKEIRPQLKKEFKAKNLLAVPELRKVVINVGLGEALEDKKLPAVISEELKTITGQQPRMNKARQSIAGFKLREGDTIGLSVTLRRDRMFDFVEKLFKIVLPRVRDFQGVSLKSFDGQGNYTLGLREQTVFPEVDFEKVKKIKGMAITFVTSADENEKTKRLLELLGMPFEKKEDLKKNG